MENKEIASVLKMVGQLMELHDEEKFKTRSYTNASFQISKYPHPLRELDDNKLLAVPGVGKNLVPKIRELIDTGEMSYLNQSTCFRCKHTATHQRSRSPFPSRSIALCLDQYL